MDTGLLILRVAVGLLMIGHGTQKLFGWFGGHGIAGTGGFFESLGYRPGKPHATLAGLTEAGGGLLLALGLFTPLACAALLGVMVNAIGAVHWRNGLWVTEGGIEYPLVVASITTAVAFTGPGQASIDHAADWYFGGVSWGAGALAVGLISGLVLLAARRKQPATAPAGSTVSGEATTTTTTAADRETATR